MTGTFRYGRQLACVATLAALPLSACAAGYQAETSRERTTLTSVSAAKGDLTMRNIFVVGPNKPGGSVGFYLAIFNGGAAEDRLVSVSSPVASTGTVPKDPAIAGGGQLFFNNGDADVPQLTDLKSDVLIGQTVPVTLTFARAGEVTITTPVVDGNGLPGPSQSPTPTPSPRPKASARPSAAPSGPSATSAAP